MELGLIRAVGFKAMIPAKGLQGIAMGLGRFRVKSCRVWLKVWVLGCMLGSVGFKAWVYA